MKGQEAEQLAALYLQSQGFSIITTNYRWERGELDIVAWEGDVLCFVEVRHRRNTTLGTPLETVSRQKQAHLGRSAAHYLTYAWQKPACPCRFDVVSLIGDISAGLEGLETTLLRDAFRLGLQT